MFSLSLIVLLIILQTSAYVPARAGWTQPGARSANSPGPPQTYGPPESNPPARFPRTSTGSNYYEDVDPRFADQEEAASGDARLPSALLPGPVGEPQLTESLEDLPEGARSPAVSETSQFTSISERPVNPRWRPPPAPAQQRTNVLLENNPDFELRPPRGRGGAMGTGGRMPPLPIPREPSRYPLP